MRWLAYWTLRRERICASPAMCPYSDDGLTHGSDCELTRLERLVAESAAGALLVRAQEIDLALQAGAIGQVTVDSIQARLARGQNVSDQPAAPLRPSYAKYKARRSPPAIRNWKLTGRTLRALRVLRANENRAVIGFSDPEAGRRAAIQNRRERQFGLSPANWRDVIAAVKQMRWVRIQRQAA